MADDEQPHKDEAEKSSQARKRKMSDESPSDPMVIPSTSNEGSNLPPWVAGASPAKFVAPEELLKMSVAMDNLTLVHEIAIDPNYSIPTTPSNPIEAAIRQNMLRAYWDLLREDLAKDPPVYMHAFNRLMEIKQTILDDILTSRHVRLRAEVNLILDENTLRNKMEQNCLDIKALSVFLLELLGRLCAPERDSMIEELRGEENIVELISGIFELLDVMKSDLANYALSQNRATVEEHSAKLEYQTFLQYLENFPDGSKLTSQWLRSAFDEICPPDYQESSSPETKRERTQEQQELVKSTSRGYLKLVQSESPDIFPETLRIDRGRLSGLAEKFLQMIVTTSAVFVTCNIAGKEVTESEGFKATIKNHLIAITNDIEEKNLESTLESVVEQCVKEVDDRAKSLSVSFSLEQANMLRVQLKSIADSHNAVRLLVFSRVSRFVETMLCSPDEVPHRLLPGLSVIERELCAFTARLLRICVHNRRTFYTLYENLLDEFRLDRKRAMLPGAQRKEEEEPKPSTSGETA